MRRQLLIGGVVSLLLVALLIVVFFKPIRIFTPELYGLTCPNAQLCIDDISRRAEAVGLAKDAMAFVEKELGPIETPIRILFCSTEDCFERFGNPAVAALYFWGAKIAVINAKGWEPHILRHEIIHHWQGEALGGASAALKLPRWYIEGMAYVLSQDPRAVIPNATAQAQRKRFQTWLEDGNDWRVPPR